MDCRFVLTGYTQCGRTASLPPSWIFCYLTVKLTVTVTTTGIGFPFSNVGVNSH
jgi:hypothetical protein